jgi:basic membrane protein A
MMLRRAFVLGGTALVGAAAAACSHPERSAQAGTVRLAMVTDTGGLGDRAFNDNAYLGLVEAKAKLHAEIAVLQSRSAADYQPNLTVLANKEYDAIFAAGYLMARDLDAVATLFPQRHFVLIDAVVNEPNVTSVTFREQEGSFLAGAAAAMVTKTKTIAFIGGVDIPLIEKFGVGYAAGARQIDPSITVLFKYVGAFNDPAAAKEIAGVLIDQHADVLYSAASKSGLGVIDQVKSRPGVYVIGVDVDQDGLAPGRILTSMIKRVDTAVLTMSQLTAAGHIPSGHIALGLKDGAIGLSPFRYTRHALTPAQFHHLDLLRSAVIAGKIVPPYTRDGLATFAPVQV